jgi:hypothetical protein
MVELEEAVEALGKDTADAAADTAERHSLDLQSVHTEGAKVSGGVCRRRNPH